MSRQSVGIREFRDNLATYLLESDKPLAITRHGDTIGYYLPTRRKRTEAEKRTLEEAATRLQEDLIAKGLTEEDIVADFKRWKRDGRK
jgi:PHD/YefM family antitoxin component YafN of YafNO toxin-antitoxin module